MKARKAFIIERILCYGVNIVFIPITLLYILFYYLTKLFTFIMDKMDEIILSVSHKLFLLCDERDIVKNEYIYNRMSVKALYEFLKENNKL